MRPGFLVAPLAGLILCAPAPAQPADARANAAMKYWQAFGLMPALTKDQEKVLHEWDKAPLDATALKLLDQSMNSLRYLHRGAGLARCDWGLDYEDGIALLMPHTVKARTLAQLAALSARHSFEAGDVRGGWDVVLDLLHLARHVEADPLMIDQLVGYSIEGMALQAAAPHLPASKAVLADVAAALDRLPPGATFAQMLRIEKQTCADWLVRELRAAEKAKPGSWRTLWNTLFGPPEGGAPAPKVPAAESVDAAVKMLEAIPPLYDEVGKLTERPWIEFDSKFPEVMRKARESNPAAAAIFPALDKIVAAKRRADARLALLKAAIAVVRHGPDAVKETKDPFGDGPFESKATDGGFELTSKLKFKGQPVTLVVGKK